VVDYTGKVIYMGIDVHKNSYSVAVICDKTVLKRDKLTADPEVLFEYSRKFKNAKIKSAYEAGFCGFYLHRFLNSKGINNIIVNPASIAVSAKDSVKTDKRDALKIAVELADDRLVGINIPSDEREDKRHLTRLREQFVKQKNRTACQIKSLLHLYGLIEANTNPRVCENWFLAVDQKRMKENCKYRFASLCKTWEFFNSQIKDLNKKIKLEVLEDFRLDEIWQSFPGIGPTTARKLINELDDMSQFSNEQKLFSYAGLIPKEHSSGDHTRQGSITKQGKPIIRRLLVEAAWIAIKKDASLNAIFNRIAVRKAGKKKAIVAIARILLGRARTCIKENRLYTFLPKEKATIAA
jgi:transposase